MPRPQSPIETSRMAGSGRFFGKAIAHRSNFSDVGPQGGVRWLALSKPEHRMHHETPLIGTIVVGLVVAFIFGALAQRLRVSPVAGYLFAGVAVGPFTPGFVADRELALELAELGVILLMFGLGLPFSLRDLLSVRNIAVPCALLHLTAATHIGMALARLLGWSMRAR